MALNVRATPAQYDRWRAAADFASRSLSAWVADWLDELAGVPSRVLPVVDKLVPHFAGRVPLRVLQIELQLRRGWGTGQVNDALRRLAELSLLLLLPEDQSLIPEGFAARDALRTSTGQLVAYVALPIHTKPRPFKRI